MVCVLFPGSLPFSFHNLTKPAIIPDYVSCVWKWKKKGRDPGYVSYVGPLPSSILFFSSKRRWKKVRIQPDDKRRKNRSVIICLYFLLVEERQISTDHCLPPSFPSSFLFLGVCSLLLLLSLRRKETVIEGKSPRTGKKRKESSPYLSCNHSDTSFVSLWKKRWSVVEREGPVLQPSFPCLSLCPFPKTRKDKQENEVGDKGSGRPMYCRSWAFFTNPSVPTTIPWTPITHS